MSDRGSAYDRYPELARFDIERGTLWRSARSLRCVGVFDILGFRAMLGERGLEDVNARYRGLINEVVRRMRWEAQAGFFSDTIVLYSAPFPLDALRPTADRADGEERAALWRGTVRTQVNAFINYAALLMQMGIQAGLPLRGGIALGDTVVVKSRNLYLGPSIVDAYETEQAQEWVGVALHPSCYEWIPDLDQRVPYTRAVRWPVPQKQPGRPVPLEFTVNWMQGVGSALQGGAEEARGSAAEAKWTHALELFAAIKAAVPAPDPGEGRLVMGPEYHAY